jgi:archaellin
MTKSNPLILTLEIVVAIVLIMAGISTFLKDEFTTISYAEVVVDVENLNGVASLQSFETGEELHVKDLILDTLLFERDEEPYTLVVLDGFNSMELQLCLKGNQTGSFEVGKYCVVPVHVKQYNVSNQEVNWLEEWYNYYQMPYNIKLQLYLGSILDLNSFLDINTDLKDTNELEEVINKALSKMFSIASVAGYTNVNKTLVEYLAITINPKFSSTNIDLSLSELSIKYEDIITILNLNESLIQYVNIDNTSVFYTPIESGSDERIIDYLSENDFAIISIYDADNSIPNNLSINSNDIIISLIDIGEILKSTNGLPPDGTLSISLQPDIGLLTEFDIRAPSVFRNRILNLN